MNYIACLPLKPHNKRTLSHVHRVCDMYVNLVLKRKKKFRENWLKFLGIWGAAELIWGFGEHKQNTFRELRQKLSGILGDQSIIFRELGSKDPPPPEGGHNYMEGPGSVTIK